MFKFDLIISAFAPSQIERKMFLWVNEEVGCKSKKFEKSEEEWPNNLAEMEKGLWFKQSSLTAYNQYTV